MGAILSRLINYWIGSVGGNRTNKHIAAKEQNDQRRYRKKKAPALAGARRSSRATVRSVHSAHSAARHSGRSLILLLDLGDEGLGREHEAGDGGRVLEGVLGDLGGIDDPGLDHVFDLLAISVEAEVAALVLELVDDHRALGARVRHDLTGRLLQRAHDHSRPDLLVTRHPVGGLLDGVPAAT